MQSHCRRPGGCTASCTGRWRRQLRAVTVPTFVKPRKSSPNAIRGRHLQSVHHFCANGVKFSTAHSFVRFHTAIGNEWLSLLRHGSVATVTRRTGKCLQNSSLRPLAEFVVLHHDVSTAPIMNVMENRTFSRTAGVACLHSRRAGYVCPESQTTTLPRIAVSLCCFRPISRGRAAPHSYAAAPKPRTAPHCRGCARAPRRRDYAPPWRARPPPGSPAG